MSKGITPEFLEELKYKCDIVEIVSQYVPLQKKGGRYFGCCPFHNEKTGSFCVNQNDGYYHCFGCGASGDVIKFVSEEESISFMDAVKLLADKVGLQMPEVERDPQYEQKKARRDVLKQLMKDAARYYRNNLTDPVKGKEAREYLEGRGISEDTAKRYGLGLSLDFDSMPNFLRRKGYKLKDLRDCGLISNEEHPADAFGARIIVPILNGMDEVVAFGGRIYHGEKDVAKYKNSTNTELFDKGRTVYGANRIKRDRREGKPHEELILVEGYMDVISLGAAGVLNAVACMGTALTEGQAREIRRLSQKLFVCYDGDEAGRKASIKNIETLHAVGIELKVVSLDDGKDPDETVRQDGVERFYEKLKEAKPYLEYKLFRAQDGCDLDTVNGRSKYLARAMDILAGADFAEQTMYLPYVAEALKGTRTVESIEKSLAEKLAGDKKPPQKEEKEKKRDPKLVRAARAVIYCLLMNKPFADPGKLKAEWFDGPYRRMAEYVKSAEKPYSAGSMMSYVDEDEEISVILGLEKEKGFDDEDALKNIYDAALMALANAYILMKIEEQKQITREKSGAEVRTATAKLSKLLILLHSKNIADKLEA